MEEPGTPELLPAVVQGAVRAGPVHASSSSRTTTRTPAVSPARTLLSGMRGKPHRDQIQYVRTPAMHIAPSRGAKKANTTDTTPRTSICCRRVPMPQRRRMRVSAHTRPRR